jgi:peptidoglycan-associated lipoprotein
MKNAALAASVMMSLTLVACHSATPVASNPTPQPAAADSAASEALARGSMARRDSMMEKARADALSAAERQKRHADSVRAQVNGEMGMEGAGITSWGLPLHDSTMLADRIHFDYDRADLSPDDLAQLEAKRQVLVAHQNLVIQIVGNADERGPDEYNLALGERRAAAAKRWLLAAGIAGSRISIVSWGEEHPLDPGHDESAWAKNRRDEFLVVRSAQ